MQWFTAAAWGALVVALTPAHGRALRHWMAAGLALAMAAQLWLLRMEGLLTLETGLPLHLCGLFGVLSIPLLYTKTPWLYELSAFLAAPAALSALAFPAVVPCRYPTLMLLAFSQLHALVALSPVYLWRMGKPLPTDPRRALVLGSGYLLLISAFNRATGANYLFLRSAPTGTPLWTLFARGGAFYVCSLALLCMTVFSLLSNLYGYLRK